MRFCEETEDNSLFINHLNTVPDFASQLGHGDNHIQIEGTKLAMQKK